MQVTSPTGQTYTVADDNTVYDANNAVIGYVDPTSGCYVGNDGSSVSLADLASQGFEFPDHYDVSGGDNGVSAGTVLLPTADEPAGSGVAVAVEAPADIAAAQAAAMAGDLIDPGFVPENAALAQMAASALGGLATAYTPDTAAQLNPALNHWLNVGQQVLDAGTWTNEASAPTSAGATADSDGMSDGERARRAHYASLGMSPEQVDAEYARMRSALAGIGLDIDDVRVAASAPGMSALEWSEQNLPTMNVEGIVGVRIDSGLDSLRAAAADSGFGLSQASGAQLSASITSLDDMIDQMSPEPMFSPVLASEGVDSAPTTTDPGATLGESFNEDANLGPDFGDGMTPEVVAAWEPVITSTEQALDAMLNGPFEMDVNDVAAMQGVMAEASYATAFGAQFEGNTGAAQQAAVLALSYVASLEASGVDVSRYANLASDMQVLIDTGVMNLSHLEVNGIVETGHLSLVGNDGQPVTFDIGDLALMTGTVLPDGVAPPFVNPDPTTDVGYDGSGLDLSPGVDAGNNTGVEASFDTSGGSDDYNTNYNPDASG